MRILFLFICTLLSSNSHAVQGTPVFGLLEQYPVVNREMNVVARPSYIFSNQKLGTATIFTGLKDFETRIRTLCCYEVVELEPVALKDILKKYDFDSEFVAHMKSVKGYKYVYVARPADKQFWNSYMKIISNSPRDQTDSAPFSIPVVAATFKEDRIPQPFLLEQKKISLKADYDRKTATVFYKFVADRVETIFSESVSDPE